MQSMLERYPCPDNSGKTRSKAILLTFLAIFLSLASCNPKEKIDAEKVGPASELNVYAPRDIRDTGFEAAVLREFALRNNTDLHLTLFPDLPTLLNSLNDEANPDEVDLVLGIGNTFIMSDSLSQTFDTLPEISLREIRRGIPRDPNQRFIPFAFANLSILYNSEVFPQPPRSFGELQDARYYAQLALCDASTSDLGRSSLLWFVSIFGEEGYEQLLNSLRKNVRKVYADRFEALAALRNGECALMLGFDSTPAWIAGFDPAEAHLKSIIPREGSFQYVRSAAVRKNAPNRETAVKFLEFLISAETQQFVMFKLGMLPVNGRAPLPHDFAYIPLDVFTTNHLLDEEFIRRDLPRMLRAWERKFTLRSIY